MTRQCTSRSVRAALKTSGFSRAEAVVYRNRKRHNGVPGQFVTVTLKLDDFHFTPEELFQARTILGAYYRVVGTYPTALVVARRTDTEVE